MGTAGAVVHQDGVQLVVSAAVPGATTLLTPANGALNTVLLPTLTWNAVAGAISYDVQIATDPAFTTIVASASGLAATNYTPGAALSPNTIYYWRVRANNGCGNTWSSTFAFRTYTTTCTTTSGATGAIQDAGGGAGCGTPRTTNFNLNVPAGGTINDVNVLNLAGTHTFINDLSFVLRSPAATNVQIMARSCAGEDNFGLNLDDEAAPGAWPCPPVGGGTYRPSNPLSAFDGQSSTGNWTLAITDNCRQDSGSLTSWSLQICTSAAAAAADYSDLSSGYGVAWHEGSGTLRLGPLWSADSSFAQDNDDPSDDGVVRTGGTWTAGSPVGLNVTVNGGDGNDFLACWFDWNNNGVLANPAEKTVAQPVNNGVNNINFNVPAGFDPGTDSVLDSRCRLYEAEPTAITSTETPDGGTVDGEVEDYRWGFSPTAVTLRGTRLGTVSNLAWLVGSLVAMMLLSLGVVVSRRRVS